LVERARYDDVQNPKDPTKTSDDEDDALPRLTSADAWIFPLVGSFVLLSMLALNHPWRVIDRFSDACWLILDHQILWKGMDQLATVPVLHPRWPLQRTSCKSLPLLLLQASRRSLPSFHSVSSVWQDLRWALSAGTNSKGIE
jgi:hypothetical protein